MMTGRGRRSLVVPVPRSALLLDLPGHLALDAAGTEEGDTAVPTTGSLDVVSVPGTSPEA